MSGEWPVVKLAEITEKIGSGSTPRGGDAVYQNTGVPLVRSMNVHCDGFKDDGLVFLNDIEANKLDHVEVQAGDVLLNITGASIGRVTTAPTTLAGARVNQHVCIIRPKAALRSRFLAHFLASPTEQARIMRVQVGVTRQALTKAMLLAWEVPLPPVEQQDQIVAGVEKQLTRIESGVDALRAAQRRLRQYRASVLKAAVEGRLVPTEAELARREGRVYESGAELIGRLTGQPPVDQTTLPLAEGWSWSRLRHVADLKGGITKGQRRKKGDNLRDVPYLRVANVQRGYLDLNSVKTIEATGREIAELKLQAGDVLFNEGGDRDKLGRGWIWSGEIAECIHQNHVFRARLRAGIEPKFISWFGNSVGQRYFFAEGKHTTNLASINLTKLGNLPVPVPPLAEQKRIVAEVERQLSVIQQIEHTVRDQLSHADALRRALLRAAFRGEVTSTAHLEIVAV